MTRSISARINHRMLIWGRKTMGLTLEEASKKSKISIATFRDAERGLKKLSIVQLRKISKLYKRPMPIFYLKAIPKNFQLPDFRAKSRIEKKSQISGQINFEIRKFYQKKKIAEELYRNLSSEYDYSYINFFSKEEDTKIISKKIRDLLGIKTSDLKGLQNNSVLKYWKEKVEEKGILIFQFSNKFINVETMRGFVFAKPPFPMMVVNSQDTYYGRVFTIIHELVHIFLKISAICDPQYLTNMKIDKIELLCNKIAGETLVPDEELKKLIEISLVKNDQIKNTLKSISKQFKVSYGVGLQRLFSLKRIDKNQYFIWLEKLETLRIQRENEKKEKKKQGGPSYYTNFYNKNSFSFISLVFKNLNENKISNYSAMKSLGINNFETFSKIEQKFFEMNNK